MAEFKILEEISAYDNEDKIIALLEANPTFIVTVDQVFLLFLIQIGW